jgi:Family of unknown function (DUF6804)
MLLAIANSVSITALLVALRWQPSGTFRFGLGVAICIGAFMAVIQSYRKDKFRWGIAFLVIAAIFNPFAPIAISRPQFLVIDVASVVVFLLSFAALRKGAVPAATR